MQKRAAHLYRRDDLTELLQPRQGVERHLATGQQAYWVCPMVREANGSVQADASARLLRDSVVVFEGAIESLRRFKDEVKEVNAGTECGISLENFNDVKAGDVIEIYRVEERERSL